MYSELANSQSYFVQRKSEHGFKLAMFFWSPPIDFSVGRARKFLNRITKPFHLFFKKMGHSRPLLLYFRLFNTVDSKQINVRFKSLLVYGFEPRTSGIRSDRTTNWATTTAHLLLPIGLIYLGRPDGYYCTNEKRLNSIYDIKCVIPCRPNLIFLFKSI